VFALDPGGEGDRLLGRGLGQDIPFLEVAEIREVQEDPILRRQGQGRIGVHEPGNARPPG
jgi:hypothetical protein